MTERLDVLKTYKLFIDGKFPRTESGRSRVITDAAGKVLAHTSLASRKDLRDAVEAARKAQPGWASATAYNRGQVLYRVAEMMEGKRDELAAHIASLAPLKSKSNSKADSKANSKPLKPAISKIAHAPLSPDAEVLAAIDRVIYFAGWADKYAQVLGCNNPISGPYYNFTIPEATGVIAVVTPDDHPLLAMMSLLAPVLCSGNTAVLIPSQTNPLVPAVMGEVFATSDVPAGVVNVLTGERAELLSHVASHRDIDGIHAAGLTPAESSLLASGVAENIKRNAIRGPIEWASDSACQSVWWIEPFVDFKTVWHPSSV